MNKREVLVDTGFLEILSYNGKNLEVFKKLMTDLEYIPVVHPYIAANELDMYPYFQKLVDEGYVRIADYKEFVSDKDDAEVYQSYFMDIHDELRERLDAANGKKRLEKLVMPPGQTVFTYRKASMSLGDIHMMLMAFFMKIPIILTEDSDIAALRAIVKRKMNSESYNMDIYNIVDLLLMAAQKSDTLFSKKELVDIVKSIGKRQYQSVVKQTWNTYHQTM